MRNRKILIKVSAIWLPVMGLLFTKGAYAQERATTLIMCPCVCTSSNTGIYPVTGTTVPKETKKETTSNQQKWWEVLAEQGIKFGIVVILTMLSIILKVVGKKYKLEQETALVNDISQRAIAYADQISLKSIKKGSIKLLNPEKMKLAIAFAKQQAKLRKLPSKWESKWEDLLESWLGTNNKAA